MTATKSGRWPFPVTAAYAGLTLQAATGLIGVCLYGLSAAVTVTSLAIWAYLAVPAAITGLTVWFMVRYTRRERWVRWGAVALQVAEAAVRLVTWSIDPGFDGQWRPALSLLVPAVIAGLLLMPAAARWFDR